MRYKLRAILEDCLEKGIQHGIRRAHKHSNNPTEGHLLDEILSAIWLELDTKFDISDE